ncbi:hypothetical protein [Pseudomonas sp. S2_A02]
MADAQQQQIGHPVQTVKRVDMPIAHKASAHLQAGHTLADALQVAQSGRITAADQQPEPGFAGRGGEWSFLGIQHGVISPESE